MNKITCKFLYSTERQLLPERKTIYLSRFSKAMGNLHQCSLTQSTSRPSQKAERQAGSSLTWLHQHLPCSVSCSLQHHWSLDAREPLRERTQLRKVNCAVQRSFALQKWGTELLLFFFNSISASLHCKHVLLFKFHLRHPRMGLSGTDQECEERYCQCEICHA